MKKPMLTRLQEKPARGKQSDGLGLDEYAGEWGSTKVVHLLKRTLFGAAVKDVNYFLSLSMDQAVDELLTETPPAGTVPLNQYSR